MGSQLLLKGWDPNSATNLYVVDLGLSTLVLVKYQSVFHERQILFECI